MNILITGAKGMVGSALCANLNNIKNNRNRTRPNIQVENIFEFDVDSSAKELNEYCKKCDFVFNFAGVNRAKDNSDFFKGNSEFVSLLIDKLIENKNPVPIMYASSIQATLIGRYSDSDYGKSKLMGEEAVFNYGNQYRVKTAVYRFPNIMGHSKPNYNSAVSTFCNAVANDLPYTVNDRNTELELLYIDDLIEGMLDLIEGNEKHCVYEGIKAIEDINGKYCYCPITHNVTLGEIVDLLSEFKKQPESLLIPEIPNNSFAKKLYSLYLTYLPKEKFKYSMKMNIDDRGSFTELIHTVNSGQISVNISKPGITKGQHWHNSKWELFIVVSGRALIQERNIYTDEFVEFEVSGNKIEAVYMIPGWTHNIINLSDKEDLITVMFANEIFNSNKPDTFFEIV